MDTKQVGLVKKYAGAFVDVIIEQNQSDQVFGELDVLLAVLEETDAPSFLADISVPLEEKVQLIRLFQGSSSPYVTNFLEVIIQNERESLFYPILVESRKLLSHRTNQFDVLVSSAVPLSEEQEKDLLSIVKRRFDLQPRRVLQEVNPDLIGGFVVKSNYKTIDASLKAQLQALRNTMK
ncbi:F0F1 ATP synthase subunit delta [Streptococcus sp. DD13]|uniref:F0F1 ATP synthase subunit delta n=1 Tax=Streptococcus sp. DD13 TaxID=1777881 RepID=UPI00079A0895|nr:F0F1 ATP synthase subunit delta [Streptococcus sp. DD13]KXT79193.1 ATP synthase delta chain [Streptococcus sp. DD13]